jgi:hypothetical protein
MGLWTLNSSEEWRGELKKTDSGFFGRIGFFLQHSAGEIREILLRQGSILQNFFSAENFCINFNPEILDHFHPESNNKVSLSIMDNT